MAKRGGEINLRCADRLQEGMILGEKKSKVENRKSKVKGRIH
jgi:hypothetical protein